LPKKLLLGGFMDAKEFARKTKQYQKAKQEYRNEMTARDRALHGEDSRIKYDPQTGTLKEEK